MKILLPILTALILTACKSDQGKKTANASRFSVPKCIELPHDIAEIKSGCLGKDCGKSEFIEDRLTLNNDKTATLQWYTSEWRNFSWSVQKGIIRVTGVAEAYPPCHRCQAWDADSCQNKDSFPKPILRYVCNRAKSAQSGCRIEDEESVGDSQKCSSFCLKQCEKALSDVYGLSSNPIPYKYTIELKKSSSNEFISTAATEILNQKQGKAKYPLNPSAHQKNWGCLKALGPDASLDPTTEIKK